MLYIVFECLPPKTKGIMRVRLITSRNREKSISIINLGIENQLVRSLYAPKTDRSLYGAERLAFEAGLVGFFFFLYSVCTLN